MNATTTICFFDTETCGLPDYSLPAHHPRQPHLVQIAGILCEISRSDDVEHVSEVRTINKIVRPDGWTIPDQVAAIHGITTERALAEGRPLIEVMTEFAWMHVLCDYLVSYGIQFDTKIMRGAYRRAGCEVPRTPQWCAQTAAAAACKIPPTEAMRFAGRSHPKTPKLGEAYGILFGEKLVGAHNALEDVRALVRVVMHLRKVKREKAA